MDKINNWQEAAEMGIVDIDLEEGNVLFEVSNEQKEYMEQHTHEVEDWFSDTDYGDDYVITDIEFSEHSDDTDEEGWTCAIIFKEKISIIDYLLEHGVWDSGFREWDKDYPSKWYFKEFNGCWFDFDGADRDKLREIKQKCGGVYSDTCASGAGIYRICTRNWIKTESESFFDGNYGWDYDPEAEYENAGKLGALFSNCLE